MATLGLAASASKGVLQAALASQLAQVRRLSEWRSQAPGLLEGEQLVRLRIQAHCDRLRLMFFGNLRQDWAEFVLTELGRQRFEPVTFGPESRAFHHRCEVDGYLALHRLRERLEAGEVAATLASEVPAVPTDSSWLQSRRARLCLHLARQAERDGEEVLALTLYQQAGDGPSGLAEARIRRLRLMERRGDFAAAFALAASAESPGEQEAQALGRLLPRLRRRLGLAAQPPEPEPETPRWRLELPRAACVERAVCEHLGRPEAPVVYVENLLLNGLFGLLCWPALFAPLPGAFFTPSMPGRRISIATTSCLAGVRCSRPAWRIWTTAATPRPSSPPGVTSRGSPRRSCTGRGLAPSCSNVPWRPSPRPTCAPASSASWVTCASTARGCPT